MSSAPVDIPQPMRRPCNRKCLFKVPSKKKNETNKQGPPKYKGSTAVCIPIPEKKRARKSEIKQAGSAWQTVTQVNYTEDILWFLNAHIHSPVVRVERDRDGSPGRADLKPKNTDTVIASFQRYGTHISHA